MSTFDSSFPYHEPDVITILIWSSFLFLENAINYVFDHLLYCGLIGQIAIGVAWGSPGAKLLTEEAENIVSQLGYLGLILLVYEGGLQTNIKTLKCNLFLSSLVALIGISAPIGLSFILLGYVNGTTPVQAFAAGAALCSTSLGTTFTILSTSGLGQSRLGVVLTSAAMMDDIVGLVMSGIVSDIGHSSNLDAINVVRPILVSIAFAVILPMACIFAVKPLTKVFYRFTARRNEPRLYSALSSERAILTAHILILSALVAGSSYAGTSNLFAAYLAGASITWWDELCRELSRATTSPTQNQRQLSGTHELTQEAPVVASSSQSHPAQVRRNVEVAQPTKTNDRAAETNSAPVENSVLSTDSPSDNVHLAVHIRESEPLNGHAIFQEYLQPPLKTILKPFFFASIGFSIPISEMFAGSVVWRGIVYTILMIAGKLLCGLCLVRFTGPPISLEPLRRLIPHSISSCVPLPIRTKSLRQAQSARRNTVDADGRHSNNVTHVDQQSNTAASQRSKRRKPRSLYPAALLGSAMVARGEIGFLISSVAESNGVFGHGRDTGSSELFLIVTWAILLCTILGPLAVGLMVRRVKSLQEQERSRRTGREDPLDIWGFPN